MSGALDGLLVVELGEGIAAGFCGRLLAGLGATVVLVEPPTGHPARRARVVPGAPEPDPDAAPLFSYIGMGKRSLVADLGDPRDAARVGDLLARAGVVLDDRTTRAHGLNCDEVSARNPGLVWTSMTAFGVHGPFSTWRAENITVLAMGGQMALTGEPGREPLCTAGEQGWYQTALGGFAATCVALHAKGRTGLGQRVEVCAQEVMAGALEGFGPTARCHGIPTPRTGARRYALMGIYPCRDGHAGIFATGRQMAILAGLFERPELTEQPSTLTDLLARSEELEKLVGAFFSERTRESIRSVAIETKLPLAPVHTVAEVASSEHLRVREFFAEVECDGRRLRVPGPPVRMAATPWISLPAPRLGELGAQEAQALDGTVAESQRLERPASDLPASRPVPTDRAAAGPLHGVRVLDMTAYWLGPYCTKWLADFGADVIKVESPRRPDFVRTIVRDRREERWWDKSAYFNNYNRGKRSLAVDPTHADGRAVVLDLVASCDVVIENFQAGYMERIGLPYEVLAAARPGLVMLSAPAYGASGPDAGLAGVGTNMEQLSGIASLNAYPDDPHPYNSGIAYGDPTGGTLATGVILLALTHRDRTGAGQHIELAAHELLVSLIGEQFAALSLGRSPSPKGNRHPDMVPHGCYPSQGEDRWVTIAVRDDAAWPAFARLIGREDLSALDTLDARRAEEDEIDASITAWTVVRADYEAAAEIQRVGVAAAPVLTPGDLLEDPNMRARGYYVTVDDPDQGPWPHDGIAWRLERTPGFVRGPAPRFGRHTHEVLRDVLGYDDARIAALYVSGAIADAPTR